MRPLVSKYHSKAVFLLFAASFFLCGFYRLPTLAELVKQSDGIVIGVVAGESVVAEQGGFVTKTFTISVEEVLAGEKMDGKLLVTASQLEPGVEVEDPPTPFPGHGGQVLLFLKRSADGLTPVHYIWGVMPLQNGEPVQYNRPSLQAVRDAIRQITPSRAG